MKRVAVIAVEKDKRFLVMKRSKSDAVPDFWEFPGGGAEEGEKIEAAAVRELKEETSLKAVSIKLIGMSKVPAFLNPSVIFDIYHFLCTDFEGKVKCCDEHSEYKWLPKEEISKLAMVTPGTMNQLKMIE